MKNYNEDYNLAVSLLEKEFSHEELLNFLKSGSVIERQFASLEIENLKSNDEANLLMSNLVGVDGKIREAAALKICKLTELQPELFFDKKNFEILSQATIDIDGNVCRLAILSAKNLIANKEFSEFYACKMIEIINNALEEISKFTFRDKKYKINKQTFKIYWCLEALRTFCKFCDKKDLIKILEDCATQAEYTIREKCALVLSENKELLISETSKISSMLEKDENYYVRKIYSNN